MTHLKEGMKAPYFEGIDQHGKTIRMTDFSNRFIILYFYPKDNTPGCIAEALNLNKHHDELLKEGFVVIGVSRDSLNSHRNFAKKHELRFPILADPTKKIFEDYGVLKEKRIYGKSFYGVIRTTFLINEDGIIEIIISKVETNAHASQIFEQFIKKS